VSGLAQRADTFRALRAEVEASILPLATSVDGCRFSFLVVDIGSLPTREEHALVAGKIASHPAVMRFGSRVASEGGGDVDAGWARPARG
jgi:hypothetical protein